MDKNGNASSRRVELRKYPNRRYYDTTRSQYMTLEGIYSDIRDGHDVHVIDSKTGEDITAKVLAQIILDHDPPKLAFFPAALLHQLIRANEPLIRDFVDKYFCRALEAFLDSQRQFDQYLRQTLGLQTTVPLAQDWARLMMGPFAQAILAPARREVNPSEELSPAPKATPEQQAAGPSPDSEDLRRLVHELRQEVESLRQELRRQ
jgi:polyhydroxyalkanoate synthesis repressor PhaR